MKMIKISLILLMVSMGTKVFSQTTDPITGEWYTAEKRSVVEIKGDSSGKLQGTVIWISEDIKNDRAENLKGKILVRDITPTDKVNEYKGKMYLPRMDETRDAELKLDGDKLEITVSGGRRSRTIEWTRKTE